MSINYTDSFWTLFEEGYYVVLNLTIVNDNDFPLNNLTFGSEPAHTLLNNIWSKHISLRNGTTKGHIPSMPQIENAFGENPITIALRDSKTGNLVFDSIRNGCDITQLIASHDRNNISIAVIPNQITQRDIN